MASQTKLKKLDGIVCGLQSKAAISVNVKQSITDLWLEMDLLNGRITAAANSVGELRRTIQGRQPSYSQACQGLANGGNDSLKKSNTLRHHETVDTDGPGLYENTSNFSQGSPVSSCSGVIKSGYIPSGSEKSDVGHGESDMTKNKTLVVAEIYASADSADTSDKRQRELGQQFTRDKNKVHQKMPLHEWSDEIVVIQTTDEPKQYHQPSSTRHEAAKHVHVELHNDKKGSRTVHSGPVTSNGSTQGASASAKPDVDVLVVEANNYDLEGFTKVRSKKRKPTSSVYVGNIAVKCDIKVTQKALEEHLNKNNIQVVKCVPLIRNRPFTAFRVIVHKTDTQTLLQAGLWPDHVTCRAWQYNK